MREISVYYPGSSFPSVSVTGNRCSLLCAHCSGKYLHGMTDVSEKGALYDTGMALWDRNGRGLLVSGGCDRLGAVDFPEHTFDEIRRLKDETGLIVNLHCGLVDEATADRIADSGVDKVSFDLVYDDLTIRDVLHLNRPKEDYIKTMKMLIGKGLTVAPHLLAGLNKGRIFWEYRAIDALSDIHPETVVLIVLIPTKGTEFEGIPPPKENSVLELASAMRDRLDSRLLLGCMRPKGMFGLEKGTLEIGFDGLVLPSKKTLEWIRSRGWSVLRKDLCCCMG